MNVAYARFQIQTTEIDKRPLGTNEIKLAARYSKPSISTTFQDVDSQFLD